VVKGCLHICDGEAVFQSDLLLFLKRCRLKGNLDLVDSLLADDKAGEVRILQESVVRVLLLGTHAEGLILQGVIAARLLDDVLPLVQQRDMPKDFMLQSFLYEFNPEHILDLNSVPLPPISAPHGHVDVASHLALLHVSLRYLKSPIEEFIADDLTLGDLGAPSQPACRPRGGRCPGLSQSPKVACPHGCSL